MATVARETKCHDHVQFENEIVLERRPPKILGIITCYATQLELKSLLSFSKPIDEGGVVVRS